MPTFPEFPFEIQLHSPTMVADFTPPLIVWLPPSPQLISSLTNPGSLSLPMKHLSLRSLPLGLLGVSSRRWYAHWKDEGLRSPKPLAPKLVGYTLADPCFPQRPNSHGRKPVKAETVGEAGEDHSHPPIHSLSQPSSAGQPVCMEGRTSS